MLAGIGVNLGRRKTGSWLRRYSGWSVSPRSRQISFDPCMIGFRNSRFPLRAINRSGAPMVVAVQCTCTYHTYSFIADGCRSSFCIPLLRYKLLYFGLSSLSERLNMYRYPIQTWPRSTISAGRTEPRYFFRENRYCRVYPIFWSKLNYSLGTSRVRPGNSCVVEVRPYI